MSEWKSYKLVDLLETIESGSRPKGGVDNESGEVPSFGGENIKQDGGIFYEQIKKVARTFFKAMTKGILQDKDVLIRGCLTT